MDLATLAKYAGVSKATASRAFKENAPIRPEVKARIRALAEELGYRPNIVAQSLIKGTDHHIGLVVAQRVQYQTSTL